MTDNRPSGSSNTFLAFVLGAVVVAIAVIAYFTLGGDTPPGDSDVNVEVQTPDASGGGAEPGSDSGQSQGGQSGGGQGGGQPQ